MESVTPEIFGEDFLDFVAKEAQAHETQFARQAMAELPGYDSSWKPYVFLGIDERTQLGYSETRILGLIYRRALRLSDIATHQGDLVAQDHAKKQIKRMTTKTRRLISP